MIAQRNHPVIRPTPNYWKIARLEIELFNETKFNEGSPVKAGLKNEYGIDASGHAEDGLCNRNPNMGPVCKSRVHKIRGTDTVIVDNLWRGTTRR